MSGAQTPALPPDLPHDSLRVNIYVSCSVCWAIAAIFVALRFYTRGVVIRVLGSSDWSVLLALIFGGATCAAVIEQAVHGAGQHVWDLDPNDPESGIAWARAAWYGILFYLLSLCFAKISILLLYIHLFAFKWARLAGQILLGTVIVTNIYMTVVTFTACIPLESYWDPNVPKRYCHAQAFWWSNTGMHMVTDFLIFLLPMPVVWTIKLPRRQKIILSAVFGFGFIVCFISILRLLQLVRAQTDTDFTYGAAPLSYLTAVEVNGAVVCACVMTLKPLLARVWPRAFSSSASSGSSGSYYSSSSGYRRRFPWGRGRFGRGHRGRKGSGTLVNAGVKGRGPPTIGSIPSKPPIYGGRDVWAERVVAGGVNGGGRKVWVDGGYVELEDGDGDLWGMDVELAEHVHGNLGADERESGAEEPGGVKPPEPVASGRVRVDTEVTVQVTKAEK